MGLLPVLFRGQIVAAVGGAGTQSSFKQLAFLLLAICTHNNRIAPCIGS